MATSELSRFIIPNLSQDPSIALQGAQAAQFQSSPMFQGSIERQAFAAEYQVPTAVRFGTQMVIGTPANSIGLPNPVGNSTGPSSGIPPINISSGVTSIISGDPSTLTVSQPTGNVILTATGGGGGTPGGADTDVQYNSMGTFAGDSGMTYDGAGGLTTSGSVNTVDVTASNEVTATTNLKADKLSPVVNPGPFGSATLLLGAWALLNPFAFYFIKSVSRVIWPVLAGGDATSGNNKGGSTMVIGGNGFGTGAGGDVYLSAGYNGGGTDLGSVILGNTNGDFGSRVPATSTDPGTKGAFAFDTDYIYVCTATNTWKRTALSTF